MAKDSDPVEKKRRTKGEKRLKNILVDIKKVVPRNKE